MTASAGFAAFLLEQLAPLGGVSLRRMFGKTGVFCEGLMFGMISDDTFYVRVDEAVRGVFAEAASEPPLSYRKGGVEIEMALWRVPDRLMDEPEELLVWAREAVAAARRVAAKRKSPSR